MHEHADRSTGHDTHRRRFDSGDMGQTGGAGPRAGRMVMALIEQEICPRDIMSVKAFENAIAVDMAIGGSTNTTLHLPAIAKEVGIHSP